jgi:hypothetical protein
MCSKKKKRKRKKIYKTMKPKRSSEESVLLKIVVTIGETELFFTLFFFLDEIFEEPLEPI